MLKKLSLLLSFCLLFSSQAHGLILFSPSVSYVEQKVNDAANPPERSGNLTLIDLRLGYVLDFGLYLGGLYSLQDQNFLTDASDSYFGPSIGYYNSGFLLVATYYIFGERDLTNGAGKYTDVTGYQVDVGYSIPLAEGILMGPQLTFHNVEFGDLQTGGLSNTADYKLTGISPYFNITFLF